MKNIQRSKFRNLFIVCLALVLTVAMSATSFAGSISIRSAINKALKNAKLTRAEVVDIDAEYDDGKYEIEFIKISNGAEYSYEYSRSGKLLEKSVEYNRTPNYGKKKISKKTARNKVAKFGGYKKSTVSNGSCVLTTDDGQRIYKIKFKSSKYRYKYEVHARTGKVLEFEKKIRLY